MGLIKSEAFESFSNYQFQITNYIRHMKKGFSILNILIILSLFIFIYLFYDKYLNKELGVFEKENISDNGELVPIGHDINKETELEKENKPSIVDEKNKVSPLPDSSTLPAKRQNIKEAIFIELEPIGPSTINGYYENKIYNYSISVPNDWPLRIRDDSNISLGVVPPKNGQGAITIEVGENVGQEITKVKIEAKKYTGMINLSEEIISIAGVSGTKLILNNQIINTNNYYIVLSKNNLDYIIKYSDESSSFMTEVEKALDTFKFTPVQSF